MKVISTQGCLRATGSTAIDVTYTKYMSPRGSWGSVKELAIGVGYDHLYSALRNYRHRNGQWWWC